MKKISFLLFLILISINLFAFTVTDTTNVVLKPKATEAEKYAAKEFVKYIKKISNIDLKIIDAPGPENNIFIGQSENAKKICGISDWSSLDNDEIIIFAKGKNIVLAGGKGSGCIYAVYEFLDTYLGVKFLTKYDEYIPENKNIKVKNLNIRYKSPFMSRECYQRQMNESPEYCLKLKMNGHFNNISPDLGGHVELLWWAHTFEKYINTNKYGKDHPEWFSYRDGKRINNRTSQLCLSNKEMINELTKNVLANLDEHPDTKIISLTQNDNNLYCECESCKGLAEKYGQSGLLLMAVNQVADAVKKKYPNVLVETFAYHYTRHVPKGEIVPRDNVIIRLCSIEAAYDKPFDNPVNKDCYQNIKDWSNITKNLYFWDYVANFQNYVILHPNFHVLQKNLQIMRDHNVACVFEQGDQFNYNTCFQNYKSYITAKLLWNPDINVDKETKEFMKAYYGPAWKYMYDFVKYTKSVMMKSPIKLESFMQSNNYFSNQDWIKLFTYLNNALKTASHNQKYSERVKNDLYCMYGGAVSAGVTETLAEKNLLPTNNVFELLKIINEYLPTHGVEFFSEGNKWDWGFYSVKNLDIKEGTIPEVCKDLKDTDWIDIQDENITPVINLFDNPKYRKLIEADGASNGKALKITPKFIDWYIQKKLGFLLVDKSIKSVDFYITVKIEKGTVEGKAIEFGIWSKETGSVITHRIGADDTPNNQWTTIKMGEVDLTKFSSFPYFYICGMGDENLSPNVLVDRVFLVLNR